jgi:hypothetical protein
LIYKLPQSTVAQQCPLSAVTQLQNEIASFRLQCARKLVPCPNWHNLNDLSVAPYLAGLPSLCGRLAVSSINPNPAIERGRLSFVS